MLDTDTVLDKQLSIIRRGTAAVTEVALLCPVPVAAAVATTAIALSDSSSTKLAPPITIPCVQ